MPHPPRCLPAVVIAFSNLPAGYSPLSVLQCEIDSDGRIQRIHSVGASRKLTAVQFP